MIEASGVRSSCETSATKSSLSWLASRCRASRSSSPATTRASTRMKRTSRSPTSGWGAWDRQHSEPYRWPSENSTGTPT